MNTTHTSKQMKEKNFYRINSAELERILKERDMTQDKLAELAEVNQGMISKWISGKHIHADISRIDRMARALNVNRDTLLLDPVITSIDFLALRTKIEELDGVFSQVQDGKKIVEEIRKLTGIT